MNITPTMITVLETAVNSVARRLPLYVDKDDLRSVAKVALIKYLSSHPAIVEGDEYKLLYKPMQFAVIDELRRLDPITLKTRRIMKKLEAVPNYERLSPEALARELGITVYRVKDALSHMQTDAIAQEAVAPETSEPVNVELYLSKLKPQERLVVEMVVMDDHRLQDVAKLLKCTEGNVHHIKLRALKKLRKLKK